MIEKSLEELSQEYTELCHAMQSGVEFRRNKTDQTGKHLRVGINTAMSDHGTLIELLLEKGVFTKEELAVKMVKYMRKEVETYQKEIEEENDLPSGKINLG